MSPLEPPSRIVTRLPNATFFRLYESVMKTNFQASEGMKFCTRLSDGLQKSNEMGTDLLTGLEELIEDLLFRLGLQE